MHVVRRFGRALLLVAAVPALALATTTFERRWHWFSQDIGRSVEQALDGGYAVSAEAWIDSSRCGIVLAKTDSFGDTTWVRYIQDVDQGSGYMCRLPNGDHAVLGTRNGQSIFARNYNVLGDSVWTYTTAEKGPVSAIIPTVDGGCLIAGRMPDTMFDFGLVKLQADGTEDWTRYYEDPRVWESWARNAAQTRDGGYIVCGDAHDYSDNYLRLVRINPRGDTLWTTLYSDFVDPSFLAVREMGDGGFLAVGQALDTLAVNDALLMMRTDSLGRVTWTSRIAPPGALARAAAMYPTRDGGYIIAGTIDWYDSARVWLVKTDAQADTVWTRVLGGPAREWASDVKQTADGGYVIAGSSEAAGGSVLVIKTDSLGRVAGVMENRPAASGLVAVSVSPNPVTGVARVDYALSGHGDVHLKLYDMTGKRVRNFDAAVAGAGVAACELNVIGLAKGVYLLKVERGCLTATRKLVVE